MRKMDKNDVVEMAIGTVLLTATLTHFVRYSGKDAINKSLKVLDDAGYTIQAPSGDLYKPTAFQINYKFRNPFKKKA